MSGDALTSSKKFSGSWIAPHAADAMALSRSHLNWVELSAVTAWCECFFISSHNKALFAATLRLWEPTPRAIWYRVNPWKKYFPIFLTRRESQRRARSVRHVTSAVSLDDSKFLCRSNVRIIGQRMLSHYFNVIIPSGKLHKVETTATNRCPYQPVKMDDITSARDLKRRTLHNFWISFTQRISV